MSTQSTAVHSTSNFHNTESLYRSYVNPEWAKLINVLGLNKSFVRSFGTELFTDDGETYLDFLAGYGVYNVGHNHPYIAQQLIDEIQSQRPSMLQSHIPTLAAELAERLCKKAGGRAENVYFGSSGSEGVETAMKFSRAFTKRDWILTAEGGFHGLTIGALSLMSNPWWKEGFGPLLREVERVPFGDLTALRNQLATGKFAAFLLEPIQGETGVILPPEGYLQEAQRLCDKHGTLLVIDEVQTGIHRTGPFLASHHYNIEPDIVIIAKALSGGHIPVSAVLMRKDVCRSVYSRIDKAFVHASTFSENSLAMRAGLATLDVCEQQDIGTRSEELGNFCRDELRRNLAGNEVIKEVRGIGLFNAIEFQAPTSLSLKVLYKSFAFAHPGLFGQMIIKALFEQEHILCQMAGNNYMVIKSLPPLTTSRAQITRYAEGIGRVCAKVTDGKAGFWTSGMSIARRAFSAS